MFQPILISSGLSGWQFLQRTYERQLETFTQSTELQRDTVYFAENIKSITSAEDLVADRRLLSVALGAFGLQDDINNTFFIQKMMSDGTTADDALANRLSDTRYHDLSKAFGFGPGEVPGSLSPSFSEGIIARFHSNSFEVATGAQDDTMRIALYAERTLADEVTSDSSAAAKWFTIMGQPPLRSLFETALGLPDAFGQMDIDQQLSVFQERSERLFGVSDPVDFADPNVLESVITSYFARSQLNSLGTATSGSAIALALISN